MRPIELLNLRAWNVEPYPSQCGELWEIWTKGLTEEQINEARQALFAQAFPKVSEAQRIENLASDIAQVRD